ncbi:MAG: hypothetical protein HUU34_06380 [Saprospiraceae bacterium]|nr:hypothetical protein [Saprospiraceae bacterium]
MPDPSAAITQAIVQLLLDAPFYAHVLAGINRRIDEEWVGTLALGLYRGRFELSVNPAYWQQLSAQQQLSALQHEVLHLVGRHPFRMREFAHPLLFHIAADLAVNQWLDQTALPADFLTRADFPELAFPDNASLDDYYGQLALAWQAPRQYPQSAASLQRLAETGGAALDRHRWWAGAGPETRQKLDALLRFGLAACSPPAFDALPPALRREVGYWRNDTTSFVDWRRALRLACQSSRQSRLADTIKRPSRRFGTLPGLKIRRRQRIFVAVDTSGSISVSSLRLFFSEIHQLWRTGAEVTVIECDAAIGRIYAYEGRLPERAAGGGGTSFLPPLAYANQHRPDLMIYFTDGLGATPHLALRYPLLWVFTPDGALKTDAFPGRKIRMTLT